MSDPSPHPRGKPDDESRRCRKSAEELRSEGLAHLYYYLGCASNIIAVGIVAAVLLTGWYFIVRG